MVFPECEKRIFRMIINLTFFHLFIFSAFNLAILQFFHRQFNCYAYLRLRYQLTLQYLMKFRFKPFNDFVEKRTLARTRNRYADSSIVSLEMGKGVITAVVRGTAKYNVRIDFDEVEVKRATCTCPYDDVGACKHIVNVLVHSDDGQVEQLVLDLGVVPLVDESILSRIDDVFILENTSILDLKERQIELMSVRQKRHSYSAWDMLQISKASLEPDCMKGEVYCSQTPNASFQIVQKNSKTFLSCSCPNQSQLLCNHLSFVLTEIVRSKALKYSFDPALRLDALSKSAAEIGMKNPENLDAIFRIMIERSRLYIEPKISILNLNASSISDLKQELIPEFKFPKAAKQLAYTQFIVLAENQYAERINFEWMSAPLTQAGTMKSPIKPVQILEVMKSDIRPEILPFYLALLHDQLLEMKDDDLIEQIGRIKQIIKNPLNLPFYFFDRGDVFNAKLTPKSLSKVDIQQADCGATISVKQVDVYFVLSCTIHIAQQNIASKRVKIVGSIFYWVGETLHLIDNPAILRVIEFFKEHKHEVFIHTSQFEEFQETFLHKLEQSISVHYEFVKKAPAKLVKAQSLDTITEYMIYLSESEDYILITPVVAYGETEVSALSRRSIFAVNPAGGMYSIERKENLEQRFIRAVRERHPSFEDQHETDFFYLHKQEFLESGWFLDAFENWRANEFSILGFNQLKNNRMNAHKMAVQTTINSGIDWFEIHANVKFGDQEVGLKEIQKAVLNKTRYVKLGDGTLGVMPTAWVDKFGSYFRSGTIKDDFIKTHHTNFQIIDDLFESEVLSNEASLKLHEYRDKLANFHSIGATKVPKKLKATLRDYQKEGLNWLNFLDEFGFGGCLADDMGLGKTIQMIAYMLQQHEKGNKEPNLVVVPTSLLFNWQVELDKFAPHLKRLIVYGPDRNTKAVDFSKYDLVLTSYGTMLSDIEHLKKQYFNCIILDESQAIKNPGSKRYKAARLLNGRQRIAMTGTPVENNTFDLYAQLSFAMPGIFGTAQRFKDEYSTPIDKFQDSKRASELQQKIHPFVLRRTKTQVAKELPEKTEIVLHCEMGAEQQRVYDTYKKQFQLFLSQPDSDALNGGGLHILQGLTKLRQICNSPALLSDDEYYGNESAKLTVLMENITSLKDNHKILVFSQFVGMLELVKVALEAENIEYTYLTGKTKNREAQVNKFQDDENVRVFLISLKAGGTGLNLTKAEYVFLIDPWWNPAVENQAIDRAHRIGQENKVVAVRLITPNTIEEKIMELQSRKKQLVQDLVHTDASILKQLSKEDLMQMV